MTSLLSICVPTYNRAPCLAALLDRLAAELTHCEDDIEVLVADNASPDGTAELLEAAAAVHPWLRVHRQPRNLGAPANIAWLIENASPADYLWVIGDDDLILEGGLQTVRWLLVDERPAWLHLPHVWVDGDGRPIGGSTPPGSVQRYATSADMYRAHHHWLTFMSASVARTEALQTAVREIETDNAYHPLLWFFRAGRAGPCVVAPHPVLHGACEISWADRKHVIQTIHFTSLYDEGLHQGLTPEEFARTLDGLYANEWGLDLWRQIPLERLAEVVERFPQSTSLREYLWRLAHEQGRRDVLPALDRAACAAGAGEAAGELLAAGERAFVAGDAPRAAAAFEAAAQCLPTCATTWSNLAVAAHQLGRADIPALLETALFVDPGNLDALVNRAALRLSGGDRAGARADAIRVSELDPGNASAVQLLELTAVPAEAAVPA